MYGLYELNKVMDDFLNQIEALQRDILLKSGFAVVSFSSLLWLVG